MFEEAAPSDEERRVECWREAARVLREAAKLAEELGKHRYAERLLAAAEGIEVCADHLERHGPETHADFH